MTLIVCASRDGRTIAVSDALTSLKGEQLKPLTGVPAAPERRHFAFEGRTISGFAQKAIQLDESHLLLWAGNRGVALRVATHLHEMLKAGWEGDLQTGLLSSRLPADDLEKICLIYLAREGQPQREFIYSHRVEKSALPEADVWAAGSGKKYFLEKMSPNFDELTGNIDFDFLHNWLSRVGHSFLREALRLEALNHYFGGWLEICFGQNGFSKKPYLVKLWKRTAPGELVDLPCFIGWYCLSHLCVATISNPMGGGVGKVFTKIIRDPLERTPIPKLTHIFSTFDPPHFQLQIVIDEAEQRAIVIPRLPQEAAYSIHLTPTGFDVEIDRQLFRYIEDATVRGVTGKVEGAN